MEKLDGGWEGMQSGKGREGDEKKGKRIEGSEGKKGGRIIKG